MHRTAVEAVALLAISLAIPMAPHSALPADNYPDRPIRRIPFPQGGINDMLARAWAPHLGTVIIANRGGGGSMIGSAEAARAAPDGYTLLLGNQSLS